MERFLYLAVVLDVFTRRIIGWAMTDHLRTELVTDALAMAADRRRPSPGVLHHSNQGSQDTSLSFGRRCGKARIRLSTGRTGSCFDNPRTESFFVSLECEPRDRTTFATRVQIQRAVSPPSKGFTTPTAATRPTVSSTPPPTNTETPT